MVEMPMSHKHGNRRETIPINKGCHGAERVNARVDDHTFLSFAFSDEIAVSLERSAHNRFKEHRN